MFYRIAFIFVFLVSIVATPRETQSLVMIEHLQTHRLICWPCMAMYAPTLAWPSQNSCSSRCHCSGAVDGICTDVYSLQHDRQLETYRTQPISINFWQVHDKDGVGWKRTININKTWKDWPAKFFSIQVSSRQLRIESMRPFSAGSDYLDWCYLIRIHVMCIDLHTSYTVRLAQMFLISQGSLFLASFCI